MASPLRQMTLHQVQDDEESYEKELDRCLQVFLEQAGKEQMLNLDQVFVLLNLNTPESRKVHFTDLEPLFYENGGFDGGAISGDAVRNIAKQLKDLRTTGVRPGVVFAFLVLVTFPVSVLLAFPGSVSDTAVKVRYVLRLATKYCFLPFRMRHSIISNSVSFLLFWVFATIYYAMSIVLLVLNLYLSNLSLPIGYASVSEMTVPSVFLGLIFVLISVEVTLDDWDSFRSQERALRTVRLHQTPIVVKQLPGFPPCNNAEQMLARLLDDSPEKRAKEKKLARFQHLAAVFITMWFPLMPFLFRLQLDLPVLGGCENRTCARWADEQLNSACTTAARVQYDNVSPRCDDVRNAWKFVTVLSFFLTWPLAYWFVFRLFDAERVFRGFHTIYRRLFYVLRGSSAEEDADSALEVEQDMGKNLPILSTSYPGNIVAWAKLRLYSIHFKRATLKAVEMLLGVCVFIIVLFIPFMAYAALTHVKDPIQYWALNGQSIAVIVVVGFYVCYPVLVRGVLINSLQQRFVSFLAEDKWRLSLLAERGGLRDDDDEKSKGADVTLRSLALVSGLRDALLNVDSTFKVLGFEVTQAFLLSVATTVVGAFASWAASLGSN